MRPIISHILFTTEPLEIYSQLTVAETLTRLKNATDSSRLGPLVGQAMTGEITEEKIRLERSIAFVQNSFKPVFTGRAEACAQGSVLRGAFGLPRAVTAFMSLWFIFCAIWTIGATFITFSQTEAWFVPFVGIGMICAGYGIVRLGQWFARNDKQYLEAAIKAALAPNLS
jgi:hypothetical protein